jgi:PKD repeat protein
MAAPTAAVTVEDATVVLTANAPEFTNTLTDSGTYSPAIGTRVWEIDDEALAGETGTTVDVIFREPGDYVVTLTVTNADGTDDVTATINVVDPYSDLDYLPGTTRISPLLLPPEYRDGIMATPGLPTLKNVLAARDNGSILPAAAQDPAYEVD